MKRTFLGDAIPCTVPGFRRGLDLAEFAVRDGVSVQPDLRRDLASLPFPKSARRRVIYRHEVLEPVNGAQLGLDSRGDLELPPWCPIRLLRLDLSEKSSSLVREGQAPNYFFLRGKLLMTSIFDPARPEWSSIGTRRVTDVWFKEGGFLFTDKTF